MLQSNSNRSQVSLLSFSISVHVDVESADIPALLEGRNKGCLALNSRSNADNMIVLSLMSTSSPMLVNRVSSSLGKACIGAYPVGVDHAQLHQAT